MVKREATSSGTVLSPLESLRNKKFFPRGNDAVSRSTFPFTRDMSATSPLISMNKKSFLCENMSRMVLNAVSENEQNFTFRDPNILVIRDFTELKTRLGAMLMYSDISRFFAR